MSSRFSLNTNFYQISYWKRLCLPLSHVLPVFPSSIIWWPSAHAQTCPSFDGRHTLLQSPRPSLPEHPLIPEKIRKRWKFITYIKHTSSYLIITFLRFIVSLHVCHCNDLKPSPIRQIVQHKKLNEKSIKIHSRPPTPRGRQKDKNVTHVRQTEAYRPGASFMKYLIFKLKILWYGIRVNFSIKKGLKPKFLLSCFVKLAPALAS